MFSWAYTARFLRLWGLVDVWRNKQARGLWVERMLRVCGAFGWVGGGGVLFATSSYLWAQSPPTSRPSTLSPSPRRSPAASLPAFFLPAPSLTSADAALSQPADPVRQAQILRALQSADLAERYKAFRWLAILRDPWATQQLLSWSHHRDPTMRWWALAALRQHKSPTIRKRWIEALKDRDERVRLLALDRTFVHGSQTQRAEIIGLQRDPSPMIRMAWCSLFLQTPSPLAPMLVPCLQDADLRVRLAFARAVSLSPQAPAALRSQAEAAILDSKQHRAWMRRSRFFRRGTLVPGGNLRERMRIERQRLRRASLTVERWLAVYQDLQNKEVLCLQEEQRQIEKQEEKLSRIQPDILDALEKNEMALLDKHYSRFLFARNTALRVYYARAQRCYMALHAQFAQHHRMLSRAIWFEEFPLHYDHPSLRRFEASGVFLYDSFVDQLRDDFHAAYEPESRLQKRMWTLGTGLSARLLYQRAWPSGWLVRVNAQAEGRYYFLLPQLGSFGGALDLQLLHGKRTASSEELTFFQLQGAYSQAPPEDTGWPEMYVGERVTTRAAWGIAGRWSRLRGNTLALKLRIDHELQAPIQEPEGPALSAGMRSRLQGRASFRLQHGIFGVSLWQRLVWSHAFESRNLSANQWDLLLRFQAGDPRRDLSFQLSGGLGAYWPISQTPIPTWPSAMTQPIYTPIFAIRLQSPPSVSRYPLHWLLAFERKIYPALRFDASAVLEHSFLAQISFGAPPPQLALLPWTQFTAVFGMSLHFLEVDALQAPVQASATPVKIPQQLIRIFVKAYLPFERYWGVETGLHLDFVAQGFRSYEDPDSQPLRASPRNHFLPRAMVYLRLHFGLPLN